MLDEMMDDGSGPRRRRRRRKRRPKVKRVPPRPANTNARPRSILDRMVDSFARAEAAFAVNEHGRANAIYGLIQATPATAIASGATATAFVTLNDDAWIQWIGALDVDAANFLLTSFKVNGYDMVRSGPVNLAGFLAAINRVDRPTPLTGRKFKNGAKIEMAVININAAAQLFRGLAVHVNEPICDKDLKGSEAAPGVVSFRRVQLAAANLRPPTRMVA